MTYKFVKLGELIHEITNRNTAGENLPIYGVTAQKELIPTRSKNTAYSLESYKVVEEQDFVVNFLGAPQKPHLPISMNAGGKKIVTSAYKVFRCKSDILPVYAWIYLNNDEVFRKLKFHTDGAVREDISWRNFTNLDIPLPPIEKQQKYVDIYSNLQKLSHNHEKSFADLQLITDTFTEKLAIDYGTEELGAYIEMTDVRNRDLSAHKVQGISIQKKFIDSKANMDGVPLHGYKVIHPGEFAYVTVTSRNGNKVSVALNSSDERYIVSSTYISFRVKDESRLLTEFLLLWFKRAEFDRYARFNSWGSARETFDWSEMQRVQIPVPPIDVQRSIVAIYHALESRKKLTERLKNTIKEISPVLIKDAKDRCEEVAA